MKNPILMLTHNALEMTQRAIESCRSQDIPTRVFVIDNGSSDGTIGWFTWQGIPYREKGSNLGVSAGWNEGLDYLFENSEHVLVVNNDVQLPEYFYGELLAYEVPFITGVEVHKLGKLPIHAPPSEDYIAHPNFSGFLIRKNAWKKIGRFDERMKFYAQDCDYHVRATQLAIPLLAAPGVPFYHERSSTLRLASENEQREIQAQADHDRAYFLQKWGFSVGSEEYQRATGAIPGSPYAFPAEPNRF